MENLQNFFKEYKNAIFLFISCIIITMVGGSFTKGNYYQYNYERQIIKDCDMAWHNNQEKICEFYKENQRKIDDEELNNGKMAIPNKVLFDYLMLLSSILQIVFISTISYIIGKKYKKEKLMQLWKSFPIFGLSIVLCCLLNFLFIFVNGVFSSNDFLRILFEIVIGITFMIIGRKIS